MGLVIRPGVSVVSLASNAELAGRLLGMMYRSPERAIVTEWATWKNYIFLVLPCCNLPGEWLLACTIKAMYIVRHLWLGDLGVSTPDPAEGNPEPSAAEERLFARTIELNSVAD